jgi:hypothetical protein
VVVLQGDFTHQINDIVDNEFDRDVDQDKVDDLNII